MSAHSISGNLRCSSFRSLARYERALLDSPPSGGGGCHVWLLRISNLGALAGHTPDEVFRDIRTHVHGARPVPNSEISAAIEKAFRERTETVRPSPWQPAQKPAINAARLLRAILARGEGAVEADLWELSPVRVNWPPQRDAVEMLGALYAPDDCLFIGARTDGGREHVCKVAAWTRALDLGATVPELVAPNPMIGVAGKTKDGKVSYRSDDCVAQFRFAVLEFDEIPASLREPGEPAAAWSRDSQCQFWAGALAYGWPISALIDSGGKSIHAWFVVNAKDAAEWTAKVEGELFARFLVPCGVDSACRNESRLSRMPGHFRAEKSRWQRILFLNPAAGEVTP